MRTSDSIKIHVNTKNKARLMRHCQNYGDRHSQNKENADKGEQGQFHNALDSLRIKLKHTDNKTSCKNG